MNSTTRRRAEDSGAALRPPSRADAERPTTLRRVQAEPGAGIRAILKRHATRSGAYPEFKPSEDERVIQFVDDDMIAGYYFHWIDEAEGRKSYLCLAFPSEGNFIGGAAGDPGCPLCECSAIQKKPQFRAVFNVVELQDWDTADPEVAVMETGVTLAGLINDAAESPRSGPLNRADIAFAVKRSSTGEGANKKYKFSLNPVKTRDLPDDWNGLQALTAEQREALTGYDSSIVKVDTYEELVALVEDLYG